IVTVPLGILIIDPVVSESAEIEIRERLVAVAGGISDCGAQPERGMPDRKGGADVERSMGQREMAPRRAVRGSIANQIAGDVHLPFDAALRVRRADRRSNVAKGDLRARRHELVE